MKHPSKQQRSCPQIQVADAALEAATGGFGSFNFFSASNLADGFVSLVDDGKTLAGEAWASLSDSYGGAEETTTASVVGVRG